MKTQLDCLPCFLNMALSGIRKACPGQDDVHEKVIREWAKGFSEADLSESPPSIAGRFFRMTATHIGDVDIFKDQKDEANKRVLELLPDITNTVHRSDDPLLAAMGVSIIGNYMDCALMDKFDWEVELGDLEQDIDRELFAEFIEKVRASKTLLILGDNAGEIGLDTILTKLLQMEDINVTYAVRGSNILNDATVVDAEFVGMSDICEVITSGVDTPGTVLDRCSVDFQERLKSAPVVLSKGQGNFESLWGVMPDVFYAFKVKCPVVANLTGHPMKTSLFCRDE
ncbi:damage-control phosphatase ARMT1 family protein [Maridesulfovibrio frigidus]|uniref:damage-control phosphatase ARMT1 family protein n=1 Tax=Maridesulfovibrio frigidus TaxID=340956 RepID=UPI0004E1B150|nr:ARMT1-like domain-containing protein [Maridesulfovibrio frigidus]